jgi:hypothetical protein
MSNESTIKTVVVATVLSVVCSIALAAAVTLLKPIQEREPRAGKAAQDSGGRWLAGRRQGQQGRSEQAV